METNMQIKSIQFIKTRFFSEQTIVFSGNSTMNTISGKNGSGKTTLHSYISLVERAYFYDLLKKSDNLEDAIIYEDKLKKDVERLLGKKNAKVILKLEFCKKDYENIGISIEDDKVDIIIELTQDSNNNEELQWSITVPSEEDKIQCFWNLENPSYLIVCVSAERKVFETDMDYDSIRLQKPGKLSPKISVIMDCDNLYNNLYSLMFKDYAYERIIPSGRDKKKDRYVAESKAMFHSLIPNITVGNFSGIQKENQFILQAKSVQSKSYDIRELSSGEKLIWYSLLLLNYVKNLGVLIVDEPENHLHESLAWTFTMFLKDKCENADEDISLSQVFFVTHSKSIIYNMFAVGTNYYIDNTELRRLDYDTYESTLRQLGVSYINERILFVEGDTDVTALTDVLSPFNISVKQLHNCTDVINAYDGMQKIAQYMQDKQFVFMIDHDTRDQREIDAKRNENPGYFDKHFIVLERHELESYYIDPEGILPIINSLCTMLGKEAYTLDTLTAVFKGDADSQLAKTKKKYLNYKLHDKLHRIDSIINQSEINIVDDGHYQTYIDGVFSGTSWNDTITEMKSYFSEMENKYSEANWQSNWISLCDGKSVYNMSLAKLATHVGVNAQTVKDKVKKELLSNPESKISILLQSITSKFES